MDTLKDNQFILRIPPPRRSRQRGWDYERSDLEEISIPPSPRLEINLSVARSAPILRLSEGGLIIGELYHRNGKRVRNRLDLPPRLCPDQLRRHVLDSFWGSYILIQVDHTDPGTIDVTRDPSGEIPCFYSFKGEEGFITSDVTLAEDLGIYTRNVDWNFISHTLNYTHAKTLRTGLVGIRELLPGFRIRLGESGPTTTQEWSPWDFVGRSRRYRDPDEAANDLRKTIITVVESLAETDNSILLELSGGLDSSVVAAALLNSKARIVCGTLVTPTPGADERRYAGAVSRMLGAELIAQEVQVPDARFDFKIPRNAVTPRIWALQYAVNGIMASLAETHGVRGLYSGAGGDSVFGYIRNASPAVDSLRENGLSGALSTVLDLANVHGCTAWKAGRLAAKKLLTEPGGPYQADTTYLLDQHVNVELEPHPWFNAPPGAHIGDRDRIFGLAGNQLFRDGVARGANRTYRMPLLSQPAMEACLRIPSWMWFMGGENRAIARKAFHDVLPPQVRSRRSKGSFITYSGTIYHANKDKIREFLIDGELSKRGFADELALRETFQSELTPQNTELMRIFDLCMIENWIRNQIAFGAG